MNRFAVLARLMSTGGSVQLCRKWLVGSRLKPMKLIVNKITYLYLYNLISRDRVG